MKKITIIIIFVSVLTSFSFAQNNQKSPSPKEHSFGLTFNNSFAFRDIFIPFSYAHSVAPTYEFSATKHLSLIASVQYSYRKWALDTYPSTTSSLFINPSLRYYFFKSKLLFTDLSYAYGKSYTKSYENHSTNTINAAGIGIGLQFKVPSSLKLGFLTGKLGFEFVLRKYFSLNNRNFGSTGLDTDGRIGLKYYFNRK